MEQRKSVTIYETDEVGVVQIADEVVAVIAGIVANENEEIAGMGGGGNFTEILGKKNLSKGVKVDIQEKEVIVDLSIVIRYGVVIPRTAENIQRKVKDAIENMTGLQVKEVNVHITGIEVESMNQNEIE